jgi:hypothetical protein
MSTATTAMAAAAPFPQPPTAPRHWARANYLGCCICQHGRTDEGDATRGTQRVATHCAHPSVAPLRRVDGGPTGSERVLVPCTSARSNHGACGPEAHLQAFPGLLY